jgi:imidazolonepropionase
MSSNLLVRGIGRLLTMTGDGVGAIDGPAAVLIRDGRITWVGVERDLPPMPDVPVPEFNAGGACVLPGFVDAHTHALWAGVRRDDFIARMDGASYAPQGINATVDATRAASDDELRTLALTRLRAMLANGTTTVEVKSGYGLNRDDELRLLTIAAALRDIAPVRVETTYLGAHVVPDGRERADYVDEVLETLPAARDAGAQWCDVFCDDGAFTVAEARRILESATATGLGTRIHAEQLTHSGAARLAAEVGCASADHLEHVSDDDARAMAGRGVVAVVLPTAALSTRHHGADHVRTLIAAGAELAIATDCNPGTSWCESMPLAVQLGCLLFDLDIATALRAATRGGADALRRSDVGRLEPGACGDLAVLSAEHEADLVAHLGARAVDVTVVDGALWVAEG